MEMTVVNGIQTAMLAAFKAASGLLDGATLHLYQNDLSPVATTVIADITEATFSGYASEAITWGDPSISEDGHIEMIGVAGEFRPTATTVTNDIYGAYIMTDTPTLFAAGRLDDPPEFMGATSNVMLLTVRVRVSPMGVPTVVIT